MYIAYPAECGRTLYTQAEISFYVRAEVACWMYVETFGFSRGANNSS